MAQRGPPLQTADADDFHGSFGHTDSLDREVSNINAQHQRSASKARALRSKTSLSTYYPSNRRTKSMWREGVEFSNPSPARFQLPCLPSVGDLNPGMRDLEVWPSGAKSAVSSTEPKAGGSKQSKPKLLQELESYVNQALFHVDTSDSSTFNPDNFAVWQSVFQFFVERLHTYSPLLNAVKVEYELVLEDYISRLHKVSNMQSELDDIDSSSKGDLEKLKKAQQEEIDALKLSSKAKEADIVKLKQEEAMLRDEIQKATLQINDTEDRRQKVHQSNVALCGSLQFYEDWLQTFTRPENYEMMLKESQHEFTLVLEQLQFLKKAIVDKVPREDLDSVLESARELREHLALRRLDVAQLKGLIDRTNKACDTLQHDVEKLESQVTGLTPRPDWEGDTAEVEGCAELAGQATGENIFILAKKVKLLNQELEEIKDSMPDELQSDDEEEEVDDEWVHYDIFTGRGFGDDVPKYLQWDGPIKNRNLKKRDTEMLIKQFWREKDKADAKLGHKQRMEIQAWMYQFLKNKFTTPDLIADWGYSFIDAALKYKYDADCEMFYRVMIGQLDESVYWDEFEMMSGLMQLLQKLDMADSGGKVTGKLSRPTLLKALRKWFPVKSDVRFNKLKRCLAKEDAAKGNTVHYVHLFAEDKDFNQGPFAEMIRDQHVDERDEYIDDIKGALLEISGGIDPSAMTTPEKCVQAIMQVDPKKPEKSKQAYVLRGFGLAKNAKLKGDEQVSIEEFVDTLSRGVVKSSTKRDEIEVDGD